MRRRPKRPKGRCNVLNLESHINIGSTMNIKIDMHVQFDDGRVSKILSSLLPPILLVLASTLHVTPNLLT